ncbi:LutC/YkgG family protein [Planobispora longispora]|uniref:LUD domain-containing protein n=1 Tax=Planobispora longispora TaxID=28887 RepID=A0A8J3RR75_9ACTN|nr:LUD domain-containing protein [Planobispora longispora]GIH81416.1 hypothetical protein Plo01_78450 [Planobispora longispora]
MSSRETVLARIRAALGGDVPPAAPSGTAEDSDSGRAAGAGPDRIPRDYRRHGDLPPGDERLVELLADRLTDYRARVHRTGTGNVNGSGNGADRTDGGATAVADVVAAILAGVAELAELAERPCVVVPPGLPPAWLPDGLDVLRDEGLGADRLSAVDGVVTAAAVAVAETGTIVLDGSADQGRRVITLLPDLHICVIRPEQVVATVPEALARLTPGRPLTWISGPSATSDIELDRVEGVHGPRNLHVVITT